MKFKSTPILLLFLALVSLIVSSCVSSKRLSEESQRRNTTIAFNAQKISDSDAAVACYDMFVSAENRLADTTAAYNQLKKNVPSLERKARNKGVAWGAGLTAVVWLLFRL